MELPPGLKTFWLELRLKTSGLQTRRLGMAGIAIAVNAIASVCNDCFCFQGQFSGALTIDTALTLPNLKSES